jgi:molybdopterin converting factor small subunit
MTDQRSTLLVAFLGEFRRAVRTFPIEIQMDGPRSWPDVLAELVRLLGPEFRDLIARPEATAIHNNQPIAWHDLQETLIKPGDEMVFALGLREMCPGP